MTTREIRTGSSIRTAVVDDHRMVADGLLAAMTRDNSGIEVVAAVTSWAELLSHPAFPVDVVVLDLNLEDQIPVSAKVRVLRSAGSETVVISRHADAGSIYGAIQAGAAAFVPKVDRADDLVAAVRQAVDGPTRHSESVQRALAHFQHGADPGLGRQEQRALVLYASGRSIHEVAGEMETTDETVKSYIKRARRKYRAIDVDLGTKLLLRRHAVREGWLPPE